jgi:hypothetical protein
MREMGRDTPLGKIHRGNITHREKYTLCVIIGAPTNLKNGPVPGLDLEVTMYVIKSQIHLVVPLNSRFAIICDKHNLI